METEKEIDRKPALKANRPLIVLVIVFSVGIALTLILQEELFHPLNKARTEEKAGNYAKAVELYSDGIRQSNYKNDPRLYLGRGRCQTKLKNLKEAISDFDQALTLAANNSTWNWKSRRYGHSLLFDIWYEKGWAHWKNGEPQIAVDLYNKALSEQKDAHVLYDRALAYKDLKMTDKEEADLNETIRLEPGFESPWHERALLMYNKGRKEKALADLGEAIRLNSCPAAYFDRAVIEKDSGQFDTALADFSAAIKADPNMERAYHMRALIEFDQGKIDQAKADISKAESLDPACSSLPDDKRRILAGK